MKFVKKRQKIIIYISFKHKKEIMFFDVSVMVYFSKYVEISLRYMFDFLWIGFIYNSKKMGFPSNFTNISDVHYYQGVLLVEVALTLVVYTFLKIFHYIKWGYDD